MRHSFLLVLFMICVLSSPVITRAGILDEISIQDRDNGLRIVFKTDGVFEAPDYYWNSSRQLVIMLRDVKPSDSFTLPEATRPVKSIWVDRFWHVESTVVTVNLASPQPPGRISAHYDRAGDPYIMMAWPGDRGDIALIRMLFENFPPTDWSNGDNLESVINRVFGRELEIVWRRRYEDGALMPEAWNAVLGQRVRSADRDWTAPGLVKFLLTGRGLMYHYNHVEGKLHLSLSGPSYYPSDN